MLAAASTALSCGGDTLADAPPNRMATLTACLPTVPAETTIAAEDWRFADVTAERGLAGLGFSSSWSDVHNASKMLGAVVGGDLDGDCRTDLVFDGGDSGLWRLHNRGDGTFAVSSGLGSSTARPTTLAPDGSLFTSPAGTLALADVDGDGHDDLFVGGIPGSSSQLFLNRGDLSFVAGPGLTGLTRPTYGAHLFDVDGDGDLDLFAAHWVLESPTTGGQYLFENRGAGAWRDITASSGLEDAKLNNLLTPRVTDLNRDGSPDLLLVADFGRSAVLVSDGAGRFVDATGPPRAPLSDENGMGSTTGDLDNDGDVDWFVSAISDPERWGDGAWGVSGNRLYLNTAEGGADWGMVDRTDDAGVRHGGWGWAACMHDFNLDGALDIFHVNGWPEPSLDPNSPSPFLEDRSVMFVGDGRGGFIEDAERLGLAGRGQGRGMVCADFDRDGDVDILVNHFGGGVRLYDNRISGRWLTVRLRWQPGNHRGVGSRVVVKTASRTMTREIGAGSNFMSHDPAEAHFGLGGEAIVALSVLWPDGSLSALGPVDSDQTVVVTAR